MDGRAADTRVKLKEPRPAWLSEFRRVYSLRKTSPSTPAAASPVATSTHKATRSPSATTQVAFAADNYEANMANFINDIRSDLNAPDMPCQAESEVIEVTR